ncbi:hypothetical protein BGZ75_001549, partial [Mortierella antarctica]
MYHHRHQLPTRTLSRTVSLRLEGSVARATARVNNIYHHHVRHITRDVQSAVDRCHAQYRAHTVHYTKEGQRLKKDLSELHQLNDIHAMAASARSGQARSSKNARFRVGTWSENDSIYKSKPVYRPSRSKSRQRRHYDSSHHVSATTSKHRQRTTMGQQAWLQQIMEDARQARLRNEQL